VSLEEARENFVWDARLGLGATFSWPGREKVAATELLLEELLPLARGGLESLGIDPADSDLYLGVVEERIRSRRTGSQWLLDSLAAMRESAGSARGEQLVALTAATIARQKGGEPVHNWPPAREEEAGSPAKLFQRVEQLMTTDLFTVAEDELVDLAAHVMDWRHVRHVPVEDAQHHLVGLVTHRALLRLLVRRAAPLMGPEWRTPLYEAADRLGLRVEPRLVRSERMPMPFVTGLLRPVVVLPAASTAWSVERRRRVLPR